ncbi:MAG: murein biosynthesis integral membrane protein MurJ [Acidimicrobiales bacterium]
MTRRAGPRRASGSVLVGLGIFASRVAGLVREQVSSRVLGLTGPADAFTAALRIPNLLQNLLGEGVLSASFVPVYSQLLDEGDKEEAGRVAGAVAALLMVVTGLGVLAMIALARPITSLLAFGLSGERFDLAVSLTRIMALGVGFLVLSAWCLGVLNSHRRFFLSYVAPVVWNAAQIGVLVVVWALSWELDDVATALAWGVTAGGAAQLLLQLPATLKLLGGLRLRFARSHPSVRDVRRRFGPALLGRGVVQLSAFLDLALASLLAAGAIAALAKAQILYTLPVSLFAMSVAAAELPEMSRLATDGDALAERAERGVRRVAFWMLLGTVVYVAAGDLVVELLFEGGKFGADDTILVWFVLAAYAVGLPAIGVSRMLQNACFATGDTKGPARIAVIRVLVSAGVGVALMFHLDAVQVGPDGLLGLDDALDRFTPLPSAVREAAAADAAHLGAVGLAVGSAIGSWVELGLLSGLIRRRVPGMAPVTRSVRTPAVAAAIAFAVTSVVKLPVDGLPPIIAAPLVVGVAVFVYATVGFRSGVDEADLLLRPARRVIWRR